MCSPMMLTRPGARNVREPRLEGGFEMATVCHAAARDVDGHHIEAQLRRPDALALEVLDGEPPDAPALRDGDSLFGEPEGGRRAGLDLAEDQDAVLLGDDVEFTAPDAVVAVDDAVAGGLEGRGSRLLTEGPGDLPCPRH